MRRQVISTVATTLSVLLVALPAQAGTVHILDALQGRTAGRNRAQGVPAPRLRSVSQTGADVAAGVTPTSQDGQQQTGTTTVAPAQGGADGAANASAPVSLIAQDAQGGGQVETVDLGDVTGTVCDCGEFENPVIRGGGFPLWPLAGLGAIPLFFIKRDDEPGPNPPGPTPPPPPPIPEPATLFLFGSGLLALGAGARRRRRQQFGEEATKAEVS